MKEWLTRFAADEAIIGLGITEPGAGSDMGAMTSTAVPDDGGVAFDTSGVQGGPE